MNNMLKSLKFITEPLFIIIPWAILLFFIGFLGSACQTVDNSQNKEKEILGSQKQLVLNYINDGKPDRAYKELRPLLIKYPEDAELHSLMGLTQISLKNPKRAVLHLEQAYKINPEIHIALNLSSSYLETNDNKKAIALLKKVITDKDKFSQYKNRERIFHNLGLAYEKANSAKLAVFYYRKAIEENPTFYNSLLQLGDIYLKNNVPAKGKYYLLEARRYCNFCLDPIVSLSDQYIKEGKTNEAEQIITNYIGTEGLDKRSKIAAQKYLNKIKIRIANKEKQNNYKIGAKQKSTNTMEK